MYSVTFCHWIFVQLISNDRLSAFLRVHILLAGRLSDMLDFPSALGVSRPIRGQRVIRGWLSLTGTTACWVLKTAGYPVRGDVMCCVSTFVGVKLWIAASTLVFLVIGKDFKKIQSSLCFFLPSSLWSFGYLHIHVTSLKLKLWQLRQTVA